MKKISTLMLLLLSSCAPIIKHEQEINDLGKKIAKEEIDEIGKNEVK